jgi:hypothetical protein
MFEFVIGEKCMKNKNLERYKNKLADAWIVASRSVTKDVRSETSYLSGMI